MSLPPLYANFILSNFSTSGKLETIILRVSGTYPEATINRECIKVSTKTAEAAGTCCPKLKVVNFSYTAVTPISLVSLLKQCEDLEVLKVAGISGWVCVSTDLIIYA